MFALVTFALILKLDESIEVVSISVETSKPFTISKVVIVPSTTSVFSTNISSGVVPSTISIFIFLNSFAPSSPAILKSKSPIESSISDF